MREQPQPLTQVILRDDMPSRARLVTDSTTPSVVYANAKTITAHQARMLEAAFQGRMTIEELLARWAS